MEQTNLRYLYIWERTLNPNEKVLYENNISSKYTIFLMLVLLILFAIFIFPIPFILFYCLYYTKVSFAYCFTNKRILIHNGWLSRKLISIEYPKITDVHVIEPFIDRVILGSGDVVINTASTNTYEVILENVDNPNEVKKKLDLIIENNKNNLKD